MKISVLLPVYNGEKYLRESIDSVLDQTYENFELLIGLNGSTDGSANIAKAMKRRDERIRVFDYGSDKGKPKTLNKLLKQSSGKYISLQDDDDIWLVHKLQKQIELAKELKENYDVIGSQIMYIDESGKCPTKWGSGPMLEIGNEKISALTKAYNNQVANSSTLIKKSSLKEVGGWDESLPALEDMELWIRMIEAGHKFINIDEILVMHRIHDNSNFNQKNWNPTELFSKK